MARKIYSEQFKRDAVKLMAEQGYSLSKASRSLGRPEESSRFGPIETLG